MPITEGSKTPDLEPNPGMPASVWRLRHDAWEYLRYAVKLLALGDGDEGDRSGLAEIHRSLRALETIEMYWAGFGQRYVKGIRDLIDRQDYRTALERIAPVMKRLRGAGSLDNVEPESGPGGSAVGDDAFDEAECEPLTMVDREVGRGPQVL